MAAVCISENTLESFSEQQSNILSGFQHLQTEALKVNVLANSLQPHNLPQRCQSIFKGSSCTIISTSLMLTDITKKTFKNRLQRIKFGVQAVYWFAVYLNGSRLPVWGPFFYQALYGADHSGCPSTARPPDICQSALYISQGWYKSLSEQLLKFFQL